jgi:hypothetical protein
MKPSLRKPLVTFTLLLAGAVNLAGQSPLCPPPAQTFSLTRDGITGASGIWLQLNTATGQLYTISYKSNFYDRDLALKRTTINGTSLLAPTDPSIPGRFTLLVAPPDSPGLGDLTSWILLDQQTGATWIITADLKFVAVPTP